MYMMQISFWPMLIVDHFKQFMFSLLIKGSLKTITPNDVSYLSLGFNLDFSFLICLLQILQLYKSAQLNRYPFNDTNSHITNGAIWV